MMRKSYEHDKKKEMRTNDNMMGKTCEQRRANTENEDPYPLITWEILIGAHVALRVTSCASVGHGEDTFRRAQPHKA